jgi:hypothetical protein
VLTWLDAQFAMAQVVAGRPLLWRVSAALGRRFTRCCSAIATPSLVALWAS